MNIISKVLAQSNTVKTEFGEVKDVAGYVSAILDWVLPILGGIAFLMIVYAGYLYMTSQGNPEPVGKAKDIIIGVIIGIALLFLIGVFANQVGLYK